MVDRIQEIAQQARQGSMAALIQYLNERLSPIGVRTRAVFAEGVLQLLCEAATVEQLEHPHLVERIKAILEELSPRNLRRVNLHARLAREQQLLWLEEISRDPENQLLWSEEITIVPPSFLKQLRQQMQTEEKAPIKKKEIALDLARSHAQGQKNHKTYWQGMVGGIIFSLFALGGAGAWYLWYNSTNSVRGDHNNIEAIVPTASVVSPSPSVSVPAESPVAEAPSPEVDAFAEAVRVAESAAQLGQEANRPEEWLNLAAQWQEAADLMAQVPPDDSRYPTAQERVQQYRQNSEIAQQQARQAL
jgi:TM2 domain-containing membrane protein YozV